MKAQTLICSVLMVTTAALSIPSTLLATEEAGDSETKETVKPTASADFGIFSQYVWRGLALSDKSAVIQPSVTVKYYGFSINLWGNLDTNMQNQGDNSLQWDETDWTVAYERRLGPVDVGIGYIYYGLDSIPDSQEAYLTLSGNFALSPTFTVYREISYYPGWYLKLGIEHSFEVTRSGVAVDLAASAAYIDPDGGGGYFNDGTVSAALTLPFCDYFSVSPIVAYSFYLSGKGYDTLKAGSLDGEAEHVFGGLAASISF